MPLPKKDGVEPVGMRLHKDAVRQLKIVAAERGSNVSALTQEALIYWWKAQPESKTKGPLFPEETTEEPTPVASKNTPKASATATKPTTKKTAKKGA